MVDVLTYHSMLSSVGGTIAFIHFYNPYPHYSNPLYIIITKM